MKKKIAEILNKIDKKLDKEKIYIVFYITVLVSSIILIGVSIFFIISDYIKEQNAIEYTGTITSLEYQKDYYVAEVSYEAEGTTYSKKINIEDESISVNDPFKIKYNKNNPNILIYNNHSTELIVFIPLGLILLAISLKKLTDYYNDVYKVKQLKNTGILIYADIEEIFLNNRGKKKKGYYPYHIRLKYHNPKDDAIYLFESNDIYTEIKDKIEKQGTNKIPVYLNETNTYNYYVDIEDLLK